MYFVSTRDSKTKVSASEAILQGLAPDGGLFVPSSIPEIDIEKAPHFSDIPKLAHFILAPYFEGDLLEDELYEMCCDAFNFPVPLHLYNDREAVLELYWGPTAAFKDFGARFLAASLERILSKKEGRLTILVATSGDTGGAVAAAFHNREHIDVKVLFPEGRVSSRQQSQLTCYQNNIEAYAVAGSFDDCQKMVKDAFVDKELAAREGLTSANSINLGRLLPQMVYAFSSSLQMYQTTGEKPVMIIPSGNVGNACASYWAMTMGAPIQKITLALNSNRTILDYLENGSYRGRASVATLANAMDVGDPSNMERLFHLYDDYESFSKMVSAACVDDETIKKTIERVYRDHDYIICPHTATGEYVRETGGLDSPTIVYSTAHPAKFETIVEPIVGSPVEIPPSLKQLLLKEQHYKRVNCDYRSIF